MLPLHRPFRPVVLYLLALSGIALVGLLDARTGTELSFSIFYLAPVGLVAVMGTRRGAVAISTVAAAVWAVLDIHDHQYSHWAIGYWNGLVRLGFFVIVALSLARLREQAARERRHASTDPLTGLANSRAYYQALEREVERARRTARPLTVAYVDIDDFKTVNDRLGHLEGDDLLRRCASTLAVNLRAIDVAARLGGDEFALVLPETGADAAAALLRRVRVALLQEMREPQARAEPGREVRSGGGGAPRHGKASESPWPVTFSIGAVTALGPPGSARELVRAADEAMYRVKRSGKDGLAVETFEPVPETAAAV